MDITIADIEKDIENFKNRIFTAQSKLELLPVGFLPFTEHKKREKRRYDMESEIEHVEGLIRLAREGIAIRQGEVKAKLT